jgi:hypothetical protein
MWYRLSVAQAQVKVGRVPKTIFGLLAPMGPKKNEDGFRIGDSGGRKCSRERSVHPNTFLAVRSEVDALTMDAVRPPRDDLAGLGLAWSDLAWSGLARTVLSLTNKDWPRTSDRMGETWVLARAPHMGRSGEDDEAGS